MKLIIQLIKLYLTLLVHRQRRTRGRLEAARGARQKGRKGERAELTTRQDCDTNPAAEVVLGAGRYDVCIGEGRGIIEKWR